MIFKDDFVYWLQLMTKVMSSVTSVTGAFVVETTFQTRYYCIVTLHLFDFSPLCILMINKESAAAIVVETTFQTRWHYCTFPLSLSLSSSPHDASIHQNLVPRIKFRLLFCRMHSALFMSHIFFFASSLCSANLSIFNGTWQNLQVFCFYHFTLSYKYYFLSYKCHCR